jgi:uncharacterized protein (DUF58 family)
LFFFRTKLDSDDGNNRNEDQGEPTSVNLNLNNNNNGGLMELHNQAKDLRIEIERKDAELRDLHMAKLTLQVRRISKTTFANIVADKNQTISLSI